MMSNRRMPKKRGFLAPKRNSFSEATSAETDGPFSLGCQWKRTCWLKPELLVTDCISCFEQPQLNVPTEDRDT